MWGFFRRTYRCFSSSIFAKAIFYMTGVQHSSSKFFFTGSCCSFLRSEGKLKATSENVRNINATNIMLSDANIIALYFAAIN